MRLAKLSLAAVSALFVVAPLVGGCSVAPDEALDSNDAKITEIGQGVEIARCWFDTIASLPGVGTDAFASFACEASQLEPGAVAPAFLQVEASHPNPHLDRIVTQDVPILPRPSEPTVIYPDVQGGFPFDGMVQGRLTLDGSKDAVQADDGRGVFQIALPRVASFEDAQGHGKDNPFVIKAPFATWQVRVAVPDVASASLVANAYATPIAPWASAESAHDALTVKVNASTTHRCLMATVPAPSGGAPLSVAVTGLGGDVRAQITESGDYVVDGASLRRATPEEAASGPCAPGKPGMTCNAGACESGACIAGTCQDTCGTATQACCGDATTPWVTRCGAGAFCKTATSTCTACGGEGQVCCPNEKGEPTTCSDGMKCNAFSACER